MKGRLPLFACTRLWYLLFVKNEYTFSVIGEGAGNAGDVMID
jgi:hypothetical protein